MNELDTTFLSSIWLLLLLQGQGTAQLAVTGAVKYELQYESIRLINILVQFDDGWLPAQSQVVGLSVTGWSVTGWSVTGWSVTGWSVTGWSVTGWSGGGSLSNRVVWW